MKTYTVLLIAAIAMHGCSKEPEALNQVEKSVTYLRHVYDADRKFIETKLVSRWCAVSGEELKRFESITPKKEAMFCSDSSNDTLELRIEKVCEIIVK